MFSHTILFLKSHSKYLVKIILKKKFIKHKVQNKLCKLHQYKNVYDNYIP